MREIILESSREKYPWSPASFPPGLSWLCFLLSPRLLEEQYLVCSLHSGGGDTLILELQSQRKSSSDTFLWQTDSSVSGDSGGVGVRRESGSQDSLCASLRILRYSSKSSSPSFCSSWSVLTSQERSSQPYSHGGVSDMVTMATSTDWRCLFCLCKMLGKMLTDNIPVCYQLSQRSAVCRPAWISISDWAEVSLSLSDFLSSAQFCASQFSYITS